MPKVSKPSLMRDCTLSLPRHCGSEITRGVGCGLLPDRGTDNRHQGPLRHYGLSSGFANLRQRLILERKRFNTMFTAPCPYREESTGPFTTNLRTNAVPVFPVGCWSRRKSTAAMDVSSFTSPTTSIMQLCGSGRSDSQTLQRRCDQGSARFPCQP